MIRYHQKQTGLCSYLKQTVLGVSATTLHGVRNVDGTIAVNWKTAAENNIMEYIVEKSADAIIFNTKNTKNALMNNGAETNYGFKDMLPFDGNNFYRIKIASLSGAIKYSEVVKVSPLKNVSGISMYPNLVTGRLLNLYFTTQIFGNYKIVLINEAGQQVWTSRILYNNNSGGKIRVELPKNIDAGNYHLTLFDKEGRSFNIALILL